MRSTVNMVLQPGQLLGRKWWPLWLWFVAALTIVLADWFEARAVAALLLLLFLPGWAWLEALLPEPRQGIWRVIMAAGLSFVFVGLGTLYLVYLPGPLTHRHLLVFSAVFTLPPLVVAARRQNPSLSWPDRRLWLLLLIVLATAAAMRRRPGRGATRITSGHTR